MQKIYILPDLLNYTRAFDLLKESKRICIISHINPDGDSIGASLSLYHYLKKRNFEVSVIAPSEIPGFLQWIKGVNEIVIGEVQPLEAGEILSGSDLIFCVDFNSLKRAGATSKALIEAKAKKILIDHHPNPTETEFDCMISEIDISSTSELIYEFIIQAGDTDLIDKDIAAALYTGIITDTGSFSYNCNHISSYNVVADLLSRGIDGAQLHNLIYNNNSEDRIRLLGHCLKSRLIVLPDLSTAYVYLTKEDLTQFNYRVGDTEDVVNIPLSINGINLSGLFTERDGLIRISLRSKGEFSVNDFIRKYFEGGGHKNAAGANSYVSIEETIDVFVNAVKNHKNQIINSSK